MKLFGLLSHMEKAMLEEAFKDYQNFTPTTAHYSKDNEMSYLVVGLSGEFAELEKKLSNGGLKHGLAAAKDEAGDCMWFISQICNYFQISLLEMYQQAQLITTYREDTKFDLEVDKLYVIDVVIKLNSLYAKFKRADYDLEVLQVRLYTDLKFFLECLLRVVYGAPEINNYENVMELFNINKNKLTKRVREGKIKGDGDNR